MVFWLWAWFGLNFTAKLWPLFLVHTRSIDVLILLIHYMVLNLPWSEICKQLHNLCFIRISFMCRICFGSRDFHEIYDEYVLLRFYSVCLENDATDFSKLLFSIFFFCKEWKMRINDYTSILQIDSFDLSFLISTVLVKNTAKDLI